MGLLSAVSIITLLTLAALYVQIVSGDGEQPLLYLEQGQPGVVPCPLIGSRFPLDEVEAEYWYRNGTHLLISWYEGLITPAEGVSPDQYNFTDNLALVIRAGVDDSAAGLYQCALKPLKKLPRYADVWVGIKATPPQAVPRIVQCQDQADNGECEVECDLADRGGCNLFCEVSGAKPPVELEWSRELDPPPQVSLDSSGRSELRTTYTTSSSVLLPQRYRCQAYGVALGDRNGSSATVTVLHHSKSISENSKPTENPKLTTKMHDEVSGETQTGLDRPSAVEIIILVLLIILIIISLWILRRRKSSRLVILQIAMKGKVTKLALDGRNELSYENLLAVASLNHALEKQNDRALSAPSRALEDWMATDQGNELMKKLRQLKKNSNNIEREDRENELLSLNHV